MRVWDIKIHAPDDDRLCRIELRTGHTQHPDYLVQLPPDVVGKFRGSNPPGKVRGEVHELDNSSILDAAADRATAQFLGKELLSALLTDRSRGTDFVSKFVEAIVGERDEGSRTWLRLDVTDAGELTDLPWEMLYASDPAVAEFIATSDAIGLSRFREANRPAPEPAQLPLKMLLVVADPTGMLGTEDEVRRILAALTQAGVGADGAQVQLLDPPLRQATRRSFARRVAEDRPNVIHYIGHGSFEGTTGRLHLHGDQDPNQVDYVDAQGVRRQNIWHRSGRRLAECGPRLGFDVRRRACGAASADILWSVA